MLKMDGERAIPEAMDFTLFTRLLLWEHLERYKLAQEYAKGRKVLDIASGAGYGTRMLKDATEHDVVGVDVSKEALEHAASRYGDSGIKWVHSSVEEYGDYSLFDMVVSFETIEHLENPVEFVQRVFTSLADDGLFLVSAPVAKFSRYDLFHRYHFSVSELYRVVREAGFRVLEELTTAYWIPPWRAVHSLIVRPRETRDTWKIPPLSQLRISFVGHYYEDLMLVCGKNSARPVDSEEKVEADRLARTDKKSSRLGRRVMSIFRNRIIERRLIEA